MILKIVTEEDILRVKSNKYEKELPYIRELLMDMRDTMDSKDGVGLAAIQVGHPIRAFITNVPSDGINIKLNCVNPIIVYKSEEMVLSTEGCLSIPNAFGVVKRHREIILQYFDVFREKKIEIKATGLLSSCIQHEMEHLDGILITDKMEKI